MSSMLSVDPLRVISAAAELDVLAGAYMSVLNVSEQTVAKVPLINLGMQSLGFQRAHANFLQASIESQRLLVQAQEMLYTTSMQYQVQDLANTISIAATM